MEADGVLNGFGYIGNWIELVGDCQVEVVVQGYRDLALSGAAGLADTFPIVKRKDEAAHGEYRTKRVILEIYDAMQQAIETDQPYQTLLDPPPADPRVAHPAKKMEA